MLLLAWLGGDARGAGPDLGAWEAAPPALDAAPEWFVRSGTVWMRADGRCLPGRATDARLGKFAFTTCEEGEVRCTVRVSLGPRLQVLGSGCAHRDHSAAEHYLEDPAVRLLVADAAGVATWREVVQLTVGAVEVHEAQTCATEPAKGRRARAATPVAPLTRTCVQTVPGGLVARSAGKSPPTVREVAGVDCSAPCPPDAGAAGLQTLVAAVGDGWWLVPDAPSTSLYASRASCEADPGPGLAVPAESCAAALTPDPAAGPPAGAPR